MEKENWEMEEEKQQEQEDKDKYIRPREWTDSDLPNEMVISQRVYSI